MKTGCATRSPTRSSCCTTSRRWSWPPGASSAPRRWCAGSIRSSACCRPTVSWRAIEGGGLAVELSEWALDSACAQLHAWRGAGHPQVSVAVNLSSRQFADERLVARVEAALRKHALDPGLLELELTENIVMQDAERFGEKLRALKRLGIRLSLDDFGTGYSSLRYLKRFPLDRLKIDQSFIADVTTNPDDAAIVRAVISLGHSLGLELVAEGVETEAQIGWLRRERCDQIQGYYFSQAVPAAAFERLLVESRSLFPPPSVRPGIPQDAADRRRRAQHRVLARAPAAQ